jgi:hypothetical protein
METNQLIAALASDTRPVRSGAAIGRLAVALGGGGAAVAALIAAFLGDPLLGVEKVDLMTFGAKAGFATSLLLISLVSLHRSARPGHDPRSGIAWLIAPVALMALLAAVALARAPAEARSALIFGPMWRACLLSVTLFSAPVFGLLVWAFRRLAPTDLKLAGMLAGLASGTTAALVYAFHCPETSPAFVLVWYGIGIGITSFAGRLAGPFLLKW